MAKHCGQVSGSDIMAQNYGLGRGLSSLIPQKNKKSDESSQEELNYFGVVKNSTSPGFSSVVQALEEKKGKATIGLNSISEIEISKIVPNPHQPRLQFDEAKLQELSDSIKTHGIIQPLIVTQNGAGYELVAGERRFQAARLAGLTSVPVIVRKADEQQKLELAIVENVQRHDLSPIEEAKSYKKLAEEFDLSQEEIASKLGKSRSAVANKIRLLGLPVEIQRSLVEGKITEGHCKLLLAIPNAEKQRAFYEMIMKGNLTVRQTEEKTKEVTVRHHKRTVSVDPRIKQIEEELS
ncbi:MAG TPA: ParB/RepB/Spo0J family partition protein, partial [Patescibacteria group bacterium]|nr:ParB/RepB/Spo0J family partition protein [Patescibacteria group bacterium]